MGHTIFYGIIVEEHPFRLATIYVCECGVVTHGFGTTVQHAAIQQVPFAAQLESLFDVHWPSDFGAKLAEALQVYDQIVWRLANGLLF